MKKIFAVALATIGGVALTACCGSCGPKGNPVYQRPCCAQSGGSYGGGGYGGGSYGGGTMMPAPQPAPQQAPSMPKPAGGQMACGAGKCG